MRSYWESEILVLGCGNILLGDDGFGPAVADRLLENHDLPATVTVINAGTSVRTILFNVMLGEDRPHTIIIIDAVDAGEEPGAIFQLDVDDIPEKKIDDFSMHQLPTSNLLRELQDVCRVNVVILVSQVDEIPEEVAPGLSPILQSNVAPMCERVLELLNSRE